MNLLLQELRGAFDFFFDFTNRNPDSPGFGLTVDSTRRPDIASIASTGFALTAWVIAAERGYCSKDEARRIVRGTLHTLLERASHHHGFFAHFLDLETARRWRKCEYSTIDTALCLNGIITATAYFYADSEIAELAAQLLERVDWRFILFEQDNQAIFYMSYNPDEGGDYVEGAPGFISRWDMAAEQKMMYLQAASRLEPALARRLYQGFRRDIGYFQEQPIIINPGGNLFAYQFSEAWLDTARWLDPDGIDWFENTRRAALANRQFCIEQAARFKTYSEHCWGLSAGDSPRGYAVFGAPPCLEEPHHDGTISIYAAIACLPFIPTETLALINFLYHHHQPAWGQYGFFDACNLNLSPAWYSQTLYAIDKGISMLMIENHLSRLIWEVYTSSPLIRQALEILQFQPKPSP